MHELGLCMDIVQCIEEAARREGFERVHRVHLEIGAFAAVEVSALRFCYDAVTRDTVAAGSSLDIDRVAGEARCERCGRTVALSRLGDPCPRCDSHALRITAGQDMRVVELEVE
ncbi:MAG: hydrogenase maturation nickel metallochaperone HypA [Pseudomonadales bacterium]|jgi:hydrogenase nickel incorporation protein HypA/HybF|nr:hydrogenase maturation nickel metallochaperone HypA [Pseudomonadales bacterium]